MDEKTSRVVEKSERELQPGVASSPHADNSSSIEPVLRLWRRRRWIFTGVSIALALAAAYLVLTPKLFRAEAVVLPRESNAGSGLAAQLGQLSGLASTVGINLAQTSKEEPLAIVRSKGFTLRFLEARKIVPLIADAKRKQLFTFGTDAVNEADLAAEHFMRDILSVSQDKKTGLVYVGIEWTDAAKAAEWANSIVGQLNEEMRLRALREADRNISYLRQQVDQTDSVALQQSAGKLLESELNKRMLAAGTGEYSFRIIDEARPSLRPTSPRSVRVLIWAFFFGAVLSAFSALTLDLLAGLRAKIRNAS